MVALAPRSLSGPARHLCPGPRSRYWRGLAGPNSADLGIPPFNEAWPLPVRRTPAQLDLHPRPTHSGHSGRCFLPCRLAARPVPQDPVAVGTSCRVRMLQHMPLLLALSSQLHLTGPSVLIQQSSTLEFRGPSKEPCQSPRARGQLTRQRVDALFSLAHAGPPQRYPYTASPTSPRSPR